MAAGFNGAIMRTNYAVYLRAVLALLMISACGTRLYAGGNEQYPGSTLPARYALHGYYERAGGIKLDLAEDLLFSATYYIRKFAAEELCGNDPVSDEPVQKDPLVIPLLIYSLENDPVNTIREAVAEKIVGFSNDYRILQALKNSLKDKDDSVKVGAAKSIFQINAKDKEAIDACLDLFYYTGNNIALVVVPVEYEEKKDHIISKLKNDGSIVRKERVASWLLQNDPDDIKIRDIYVQVCLEYVQEAPGVSQRKKNHEKMRNMTASLRNVLSINPEYYKGRKDIVDPLKKAIRNSEKSPSKYSKDEIDAIRGLLQAME